MSAGELESGNAGEPAKLIRQRYREASDVIKKGRMCSLFINDLDAGKQLRLNAGSGLGSISECDQHCEGPVSRQAYS